MTLALLATTLLAHRAAEDDDDIITETDQTNKIDEQAQNIHIPETSDDQVPVNPSFSYCKQHVAKRFRL